MIMGVRRLVAVLLIVVAFLACNVLAADKAVLTRELTKVKTMPDTVAMTPVSLISPQPELAKELAQDGSSSSDSFDHTIVTGGIVVGVVIVLIVGVSFFLLLCAEAVYIIRNHFRRIREHGATKKGASM